MFFIFTTLLFLSLYLYGHMASEQQKKKQLYMATTFREPNPYLQTLGLIKQTECREGVNSCLITSKSNDNNNHIPFQLT